MKRTRLVAAALLSVAAFGTSGCVSHRAKSAAYQPRVRTYALAVTVHGGLQPTPVQFAAIQAKAAQQFAGSGYVLVTDLSLAERILRIDFSPNPNDPENSGRALILGFRTNPYYAMASSNRASPYPTSFGFAGSFTNSSLSSLNPYGYNYYGYGNSYYDGYTYSSPTLNPVNPPVSTKPVHPPFRHNPDYCPPDSNRVRPLEGTFAAGFNPRSPNDHPTAPSREHNPGGWSGSDRSNSTASYSSRDRSDRGSSSDRSERSSRSEASNRGSRTYSRSDSSPSYTRSEPSYSRSEPSSSSSYSSSSSSYSSSSSDSSSSSSSSSGGSSSSGSFGGSSGTQDSSVTSQQR